MDIRASVATRQAALLLSAFSVVVGSPGLLMPIVLFLPLQALEIPRTSILRIFKAEQAVHIRVIHATVGGNRFVGRTNHR